MAAGHRQPSRGRRRIRFVSMAVAVLLIPLIVGVTAGSANAVESSCELIPSTIVGTDGDDVLFGTNGFDVISAGKGNDLILSLDANDVICGGQGDDEIFGGHGSDVVNGGGGFDRCIDIEWDRNCEFVRYGSG